MVFMTTMKTAASSTMAATTGRSPLNRAEIEKLTEAGEPEDALGDDRPGEKGADIDAELRCDRRQGGAETVLVDDEPTGQPLCPRRPYVVLAKSVEQGAADEARVHRRLDEGEREPRKDEVDEPLPGVRQPDIARGREPVQAGLGQVEVQHEQGENAEHEGRHRQEGEREEGSRPIPLGARVHGRHDADRDADEQPEESSSDHERSRDREGPGDLGGHRDLVLEVEPEASVHQSDQVVPVLVPESVVEAETDLCVFDRLRTGLVSGEPGGEVPGVAGEEDGVGPQGDEEDDDDQVSQAAEYEPEDHLRPGLAMWERPWRGSSASRRPSPKRLKARVVRNRATQGKTRSHQAMV